MKLKAGMNEIMQLDKLSRGKKNQMYILRCARGGKNPQQFPVRYDVAFNCFKLAWEFLG